PRRFPGHKEVLDYLNDFAVEFGLIELVRFGNEVGYVGLLEDGKWKVSSRKRENDDVVFVNEEEYDAVTSAFLGIEVWPGKQIHSHNYRIPEPFPDQVIVVIGNAARAIDISREIAKVAKAVHISSRSALSGSTPKKQNGYENLWLHSMLEAVGIDGGVNFQDGSKVYADIILHCTGYKYHFPFLETNGIVFVDDNRVGPLYKHIFPPTFAPSLSFVGLPWKRGAAFPRCELQSKWIAGVLSDRISLPSKEDMNADIDAFYSSLDASCIPKRYTHNLDFQGEALLTTAYVINLSLVITLQIGISNRVLYEKDIFYDQLSVFSCKAFVYVSKDERSKFEEKTRQFIFIDYGLDKFGCMLYDPVEKKIVRSCDTIFMENKIVEDIDMAEKLESSSSIGIVNLDQVSHLYNVGGIVNHKDAQNHVPN
ncbi:Flavin-containing monooxygenase FMO GS-OX-like 3, partial [Capsicum chinense]